MCEHLPVMKHETINEPMAAAQSLAEELFFAPVIGFRCLPAADPRYKIGEQMDNSMDWQDDRCTGEELRGACALAATVAINDAIRILQGYHGADAAIYIIAGDSSLRGQDQNEVIISSPHVVGIIR